MYIKEIKLTHFRNYQNLAISFDTHLNVIYGDNAQGKTNILEAIFLCATSKSHRTINSKEMIELGFDEGHIQLTLYSDNQESIIDLHLSQSGKKHIAINKLPIKKLDELLGCLHVIMFSPEDLNLIKSGPSQRRRFIDLELSQLNHLYYHYLHQYHLLLKQRNALLKQCQKSSSQIQLNSNKEQLDIWDSQFIQYGIKVIEMRELFIKELNDLYKKRHFEISGGTELMNLGYEKNCTIEDFYFRLKKAQDKDIKFGSSSVGPHRDDLLFDLNGIDLRKYGSQGQQRTAALSLKLSEIDLVIKNKNIKPVLLLDDVLSELDKHRQTYLMENLEGIQTLLTCTGVEDFVKSHENKKKFFKVSKGEIA
jgi:DNA replication and repair protein RecF